MKEEEYSIKEGVTQLEFLSKSKNLIKLIFNNDRNLFFASSGDFSMTASIPDLRIYSITISSPGRDEQHDYWITNSSEWAYISISSQAFKWLSEHPLTKKYCRHDHQGIQEVA